MRRIAARWQEGSITSNEPQTTNKQYASFETDNADRVNRPPTVAPVRELLTTTQAAEELGVTGRTLARYVERGWLTPALVLPSGHYRWDMSEIHRQLAERRRRDRAGE